LEGFHALYEQAGLTEAQLGSLLAGTTLEHDITTVDWLVWKGLAVRKLILVCDFIEVVQEEELTQLCGSFLMQRLRRLEDPKQAQREMGALSQVWCLRLSGQPLVYDYLSMPDYYDFTGQVLRFGLEGLGRRSDREQHPVEAGPYVQGMLRMIREHTLSSVKTLEIPAQLPPNPGDEMETFAWAPDEPCLYFYEKEP
jgi:hypothetical protein